MKLRFSLSLKLTLIIVFVSAIVIFAFTFLNIQEQKGFIDDNYVEKGIALAQSFDASIGFYDELNDTQGLQNYIENISSNNPELLGIGISIPDEQNETMTTIASSNLSLIGTPTGVNNYESYIRSIQDIEAAT
jgi:hypothetical protein